MISIATLNCNSVKVKYKKIINYINSDILLLQETKLIKSTKQEKKIKKYAKRQQYNTIYNSNTKGSKGVATMYNTNKFEHIQTYVNNNANLLIVQLLHKKSKQLLQIINTYFPAESKQQRITYINNISFDSTIPTIMGGDTNMILQKKDTNNKNRNPDQGELAKLSSFLDSNQLLVNPSTHYYYTFKRNHSKSHIDRFFISTCLKNKSTKTAIIAAPGKYSDHAPLEIRIKLMYNSNNDKVNICIPKFKNSLLQAEKNKKELANIITSNEWISSKHHTITYSNNKRTKKKEILKAMYKNRKNPIMNEQLQNEMDNIEDEEHKTMLKNLNTPSKLLSNQLNAGFKTQQKLTSILKNNKIYNEQANMIKIAEQHFAQLNKKDDKVATNSNEFIHHKKCTSEISTDITAEDVLNTIEKMSNKSEGLDGLTVKYYKDMKCTLAPFLASFYNRVLNDVVTQDELTKFTQAKVVLIYKSGDARCLENYRPISILNVDYRIFSSIIFNKLQSIRHEILDNVLNTYDKNRNLIDNVINIDLNIKHMLKKYYLVSDISKAFDSVDHEYMFDCLKNANIPLKITNTIIRIYMSSTQCYIINGELTKPIQMKRGVRQGDAMSCFLFPLVMNALLIKLNQLEATRSVFSHADDLIVCLTSKKAIKKAIRIINRFYFTSGLKMNINKSLLMILNNHNQINNKYMNIRLLQRNESFKYLGFTMGHGGIINNYDDDILNIIQKLERYPAIFMMKRKVTILNSYILSIFQFKLQLVDLTDKQLNTIDNITKWFLFYKNKNTNYEKYDYTKRYKATIALDNMRATKEKMGYNLISLSKSMACNHIKLIVNFINGKLHNKEIINQHYDNMKKDFNISIDPFVHMNLTIKHTAYYNEYFHKYYKELKKRKLRLEYIPDTGESVEVLTHNYEVFYTGTIIKQDKKYIQVQIDPNYQHHHDAYIYVYTKMQDKQLFNGTNADNFALMNEQNEYCWINEINNRKISQLFQEKPTRRPMEKMNLDKFNKLRKHAANHLEQFIFKTMYKANRTNGKQCKGCKQTNYPNHFIDCTYTNKSIKQIVNIKMNAREMISEQEPNINHCIILLNMFKIHILKQYYHEMNDQQIMSKAIENLSASIQKQRKVTAVYNSNHIVNKNLYKML